MLLAPASEIAMAVGAIKHSLAATPMGIGCKIELGLAILLAGLAELPKRCRAQVAMAVIKRVCQGACKTPVLTRTFEATLPSLVHRQVPTSETLH